MQVYQSTADSCTTSSCEDSHEGLIYTSVYYEEEQLYNEIIDHTHQCGEHRTETYVNPPVEIHENSTINIDLPPISWRGYKTVPKILSLTNTGRTILINGQWVRGRPYIEGGPLNGSYIFSQIHFHSPSEHEIDGRRYPLEMHVVHYKTSYLTQERAMQEKDGTVVLVYLFQVLGTTKSDFSSISKLAPQIEKVNSQTETKDVSLEQIVKPFSSNYYVYWGSVATGKSSYILQWIVNACILCVTKQEADELLGIMNLGEINVTSVKRMKPENDTVFYVEEIEQDPYEDIACHTCCSHQGGSCTKTDCSRENECYPTLTHDGNKKNCGCRHKTKHSKKHRCQLQVLSYCCCNTASDACVYTEKKKGDRKRDKKRKSNTIQETTSCPSVTADAEGSAGDNTEDSNTDLPKLVCSYPSLKNGLATIQCTEDIKVIMGKKKNEASKDASKGTSIKIKKEKYNKDKNEKPSKKNSKQEVKKEIESLRKDSASLKKSPSTTKSVKKKDESDSEQDKKSKTPAKSKKTKEAQSRKSIHNRKIPIQFVVSAAPEKSFEEILGDYDTTWLEDNRFKISKLESKLSGDLDLISTTDTVVLAEKEASFNPDDNAIRTIFEKKKDAKISEPPPEDCTVNFLLKPTSYKNNPSSSIVSPQSGSEELKYVNVSNVTVNPVTLSGVRFPPENSNESSKELCIQVELLFHSNKDFECVTQEYNIVLICNQNILQEYRGILCPNNLQIGNYQKLELVPKYPELNNIRVRLQDCTVKMEKSHQLCMRAKFLMQELDLKNLDSLTGQEGEDNGIKKITVLSDAVSQCNVKEFDKTTDFDILEKLTMQAKVSDYPENQPLPGKLVQKVSVTNLYSSTPHSQMSEQSFQQGNIVTPRGQKCDVEEPELDNDEEESCIKSNNLEEYTESNKRSGKDFAKRPAKELKNLFTSRKKTVYFIYEKIEKDQNSGRKIFIGSFRTKEDVKGRSKDKKSPQSFDDENKVTQLSAKDFNDLNLAEKLNKRPLKFSTSPSHSKNSSNNKKDLVTLRKFKSKHLRMNHSKKERSGLVVGKPINQLQKDSKQFKRLADIVGIDEKDNPRISVYEFHELPKAQYQKQRFPNFVSVAEETNKNIRQSVAQEAFIMGKRKNIARKGSQSAVLILPVEVESLSKVEVILVEHSDNSKKTVLNPGKEIIPCLDY